MLPTNLFSFSLLVLSTAALPPVSDYPHPDHPSSVPHNVEKVLLQPPNLQNTTNPPSTPFSLNITIPIWPICNYPDLHSPIIHPTDCHTALYTLIVAPNVMLPQHWNRRSNLPVERTHGSCSIILGRASAGADEVFPPVLVTHAAALVEQSCVTARYGFQGGTTKIWIGGGFLVYVTASRAAHGIDEASITA